MDNTFDIHIRPWRYFIDKCFYFCVINFSLRLKAKFLLLYAKILVNLNGAIIILCHIPTIFRFTRFMDAQCHYSYGNFDGCSRYCDKEIRLFEVCNTVNSNTIHVKFYLNHNRNNGISTFNWPYFFVCLSMGLTWVL